MCPAPAKVKRRVEAGGLTRVKSEAGVTDAMGVRRHLLDDPAKIKLLNETLGRCRILFIERREVVRTRERVRWIGAGIRPLLTEPPAQDEISALLAVSFMGWCWRGAERGDPERLRAPVRSAYAAATADESADSRITPVLAAWRFLEDGGQPGLASPGKSDRERKKFLDTAFVKVHETYAVPAAVPRGRSRMAFDRGVVLHDVERIALGLDLGLA
jgi:hypothetical protein